MQTDWMSNSKRFHAWRETFALKIAKIDVATPDTSRFRADIRHQALPRLFLCEYDVGPLSLIRNRNLLREGGDGCSLVICASGIVDAQFDDTRIRLTPGEAALVPHHRQGFISTAAGSRSLWLRFNSEDARAFTPSLGDLMLRKAVTESPVAAIAGIYCEEVLAKADRFTGPLAQLAANHLRELAAHLFNPASDLAQSAPYGAMRAARLEAVLRFIGANLREPWLSASNVGERLGLTGRYVQQLMEGAGLSFSRHVRDLRLDESRRMLGSSRFNHLRITDIAYANGFLDLSHFNREFRRKFGETPSATRRRK